jgi:uroporphyrinogen decarboxylase
MVCPRGKRLTDAAIFDHNYFFTRVARLLQFLIMNTETFTTYPLPQSSLDAEIAPPAFNRLVLESARRLAMPINVYPGMPLTNAKVRDIVTNALAQFDTQAALHFRYQTPFVMSAMDLSVEAEAFGATLRMSDSEIPTVIGRLISNRDELQKLVVPKPGFGRTAAYLQVIRLLDQLRDRPLVLAGCIGPFSLASRLGGVSEILELTLTEPDFVHQLLEKCSEFITNYLRAFEHAGADGVIMAEPMAGLLSPAGLAEFSSAYIRPIGAAMADGQFGVILHNCGAGIQHLEGILETGLKAFHFGAPMDIVAALNEVPSDVVLCGNLDPSNVFVRSSPMDIAARAMSLLDETAHHRNFVLSSGCDLPPNTPLANVDAFYEAAHIFNHEA